VEDYGQKNRINHPRYHSIFIGSSFAGIVSALTDQGTEQYASILYFVDGCGFGLGVYRLMFASILQIMVGLIEITAHAQFFKEKNNFPF